MKVDFEIDGHAFTGELNSDDGRVRLRFGERTWEAEVAQPESGLFVVLLDNNVYRCSPEHASNEVVVNGRRVSVVVRDRWQTAGNASGKAADGRAVLIASMPGKVVRILLQVGAGVEAQQGVLVVEAMKMQNEVSSPKVGRVAEMRVREGQTVNAGDVLAVIE